MARQSSFQLYHKVSNQLRPTEDSNFAVPLHLTLDLLKLHLILSILLVPFLSFHPVLVFFHSTVNTNIPTALLLPLPGSFYSQGLSIYQSCVNPLYPKISAHSGSAKWKLPLIFPSPFYTGFLTF